MFTDDLVDTSVPEDREGSKGEWGAGVRRDGMIYHSSVQLVKDIISRSPGKRDRTRSTMTDLTQDEMGIDALERARRRIAGWPRRGVRGAGAGEEREVVGVDSTTWGTDRFGSAMQGDPTMTTRQGEDGDGDHGIADPGIDHRMRSFHSAQSHQHSTIRTSNHLSGTQDLRGDPTATTTSSRSGFEKRFREVQRAEERGSFEGRDMSFTAVDTSTPVRVSGRTSGGRGSGVLGIGENSSEEETVDSTESSERVTAGVVGLREVLRREAEAEGREGVDRTGQEHEMVDSTMEETRVFRTPETTAAARFSAGSSPRANGNTDRNMDTRMNEHTDDNIHANAHRNTNTYTITKTNTHTNGSVSLGERSERKSVGVGEPETPVTHRWSRDRAEVSFAARTPRRSTEERPGSASRSNGSGMDKTRDAQSFHGRAEDTSRSGLNHSPPHNTTSISQNGSRSYIKDSSGTSRSSIPAIRHDQEPIPTREYSSRVNDSRMRDVSISPDLQGNTSNSQRDGRSFSKESSGASRSPMPANQQDRDLTIPTRERSTRGNSSRSDDSRDPESSERLGNGSRSRTKDGRSIINDPTAASRSRILATQHLQEPNSTREHSSGVGGSRSDHTSRPTMSPEPLGNVSSSRKGGSIFEDSSATSRSHTSAQLADESAIPTGREVYSRTGSRGETSDRRTVSFDMHSPAQRELEETHGDENGERYGEEDLATRSPKQSTRGANLVEASRSGSRTDGHADRSITRRGQSVNGTVGGDNDSILLDATNRSGTSLSTQGLRNRQSPQQDPSRSPAQAHTARNVSKVTDTGNNTTPDVTQSVDPSATRDVRRLTPSNPSTPTASSREPVDLKTPLESAVGRHVLTWFEKHHLLEREEAAAAAAEAEAEEALRRALTVDAGTFMPVHGQGRAAWRNRAYFAVMVLLTLTVMRMLAEQALPSPADPFYYATWQTQRLATRRWASAPFPVRMMRWALRWFVGERELVDMLMRKGAVSSAVGLGRARGRLGVPV